MPWTAPSPSSSLAHSITAAGSQVVVGINVHQRWLVLLPYEQRIKVIPGREGRDLYHTSQRVKLHVWVPRQENIMAHCSSSAPSLNKQRLSRVGGSPVTLAGHPILLHGKLFTAQMSQHIMGAGGRYERRRISLTLYSSILEFQCVHSKAERVLPNFQTTKNAKIHQ